MIGYRLATADDAEALARIRIDFLTEANSMDGAVDNDAEKAALYASNLDYFKRELNRSFIAWLALEEGEIIGTSGASFYEYPPNKSAPTGKKAYISNMFTYPQHRGRGVATTLFALTVDEAKARGCEGVTLNATEMGRPIYKKYGFADIEGDMGYKFL